MGNADGSFRRFQVGSSLPGLVDTGPSGVLGSLEKRTVLREIFFKSTFNFRDAWRFLGENRVEVHLRSFWRKEQGQDLVEYSLLLAFICLAGAAAMIGMSSATTGLWSAANSRLAAANQ